MLSINTATEVYHLSTVPRTARQDDRGSRVLTAWCEEMQEMVNSWFKDLVGAKQAQAKAIVWQQGYMELATGLDEWENKFFVMSNQEGLLIYADQQARRKGQHEVVYSPKQIKKAGRAAGLDFFDNVLNVVFEEPEPVLEARAPNGSEMLRWLSTLNFYSKKPAGAPEIKQPALKAKDKKDAKKEKDKKKDKKGKHVTGRKGSLDSPADGDADSGPIRQDWMEVLDFSTKDKAKVKAGTLEAGLEFVVVYVAYWASGMLAYFKDSASFDSPLGTKMLSRDSKAAAALAPEEQPDSFEHAIAIAGTAKGGVDNWWLCPDSPSESVEWLALLTGTSE